ncbi:hypothetical protein chiPu_0012076 [Chiloscyllium punctatum]|uniref:Uncharacterized protein n=1 Tax=Chiloscyllium punctatum TaxID=137246 RepID=A0A401STA3_CHIPU|nr:hypothetical protein [Chiloscyllium punctatum]
MSGEDTGLNSRGVGGTSLTRSPGPTYLNPNLARSHAPLFHCADSATHGRPPAHFHLSGRLQRHRRPSFPLVNGLIASSRTSDVRLVTDAVPFERTPLIGWNG